MCTYQKHAMEFICFILLVLATSWVLKDPRRPLTFILRKGEEWLGSTSWRRSLKHSPPRRTGCSPRRRKLRKPNIWLRKPTLRHKKLPSFKSKECWICLGAGKNRGNRLGDLTDRFARRLPTARSHLETSSQVGSQPGPSKSPSETGRCTLQDIAQLREAIHQKAQRLDPNNLAHDRGALGAGRGQLATKRSQHTPRQSTGAAKTLESTHWTVKSAIKQLAEIQPEDPGTTSRHPTRLVTRRTRYSPYPNRVDAPGIEDWFLARANGGTSQEESESNPLQVRRDLFPRDQEEGVESRDHDEGPSRASTRQEYASPEEWPSQSGSIRCWKEDYTNWRETNSPDSSWTGLSDPDPDRIMEQGLGSPQTSDHKKNTGWDTDEDSPSLPLDQ